MGDTNKIHVSNNTFMKKINKIHYIYIYIYIHFFASYKIHINNYIAHFKYQMIPNKLN